MKKAILLLFVSIFFAHYSITVNVYIAQKPWYSLKYIVSRTFAEKQLLYLILCKIFSSVNLSIPFFTSSLFRETYHSVTSRFFSNNTCWKLIFAIHFISPTRLNKILFFYCIIMHYPV